MPDITLTYNGPLDVAVGASRNTKHWRNTRMLWSELVEKLSHSHVTVETHAEYMKLEKRRQDEIKDVGAFVGGYLAGGRRKATTVAHRQLVTLDLDEATGTEWDAWKLGYGYAGCVYSTHKHHPDKPRLRLVIPLDREVASDEYEPVCRRIADWLGIEAFDITTYQPQRLMYWPSTPKDVGPVFDYLDTPWLSADEVLATYRDWRDSSEWPVSTKEGKAVERSMKKQDDPLGKPGVIGAFCRAYSIQEAIETFLGDVYEPCAIEGRYTYKEGSTAAGLIVYDDKFAFSHHGTDPVSGKLCNAFDLVRLHRFGLRDEDAKPGTAPNKLPSFIAMQDLARQDSRTKKLLVAEKLEDAKVDFADVDIAETEEVDSNGNPAWHVLLEVDKRGNILGGIDNVVTILSNDALLKGRIIFDEFDQREIAVKKLPWREVKDAPFIKDGDIANLKHYLKVRYKMTCTTVTLEDALKVLYDINKVHSVKDYLNSLSWDGLPRVDSMLIDYLGAEDCEYTRTVWRKALLAAVTRIFEPGCKFDYMLTLVGPQGIGKSTLFSRLGGKWFTDSFNFHMLDKGNKAYEQLQGAWLVEVGELTGLKKADEEAAKSFLSSREDRYRVSYGRRISYFPRQCVFFGSTNNDIFLRDQTGNRRFWPVQTHVAEPAKNLFDELDPAEIGQIWAEVVELYLRGTETLFLSREMEDYARSLQQEHTETDEREGMIRTYLDTLLPENWNEMNVYERRAFLAGDETQPAGMTVRTKVCVAEIWCEVLGGKTDQMTSHNTKFIHNIMQHLDGWTKAKSNLKFDHYGSQRGYIRNVNTGVQPRTQTANLRSWSVRGQN